MPPFMRHCWGLPNRLAQYMRLQGWVKLVNAALLSLINEACVNVCCTTLLSSEHVGPACVQTRSSNLRVWAFRPSGKGSGEEGILSDVVPVYFILPGLYCRCFSRCLIQACMPAGSPSHSAHLALSARAER